MRRATDKIGLFGALPIATMLAMAAAPPPKTFDLQYRSEGPFLAVPSSPVIARQGGGFATAPTPNRDIAAPPGGAPSQGATLAPSLFSRATQNRGEGFLSGSTAQSDQDRRAAPGAGFNLRMPIQK